MWWKNSIKRRVAYLDNKFYDHITKVCRKVLYTYPPVPLELSDLYNIVLYKLASEIKNFQEEIDLDIYILSKAKGFAKNECRKYLTNKHKILNNFIPLKEEILWIQDSESCHQKIKIKDFNFIEKKVFTLLYLENNTKVKVIHKTTLSRRELEKVIKNIKIKIKNQF